MSWTKNPGRVAGIVYLLLVVTAPWRLIYIPSTVFVRGNAAATTNNIAAHETLFRIGILTDLLTGIIVLFVVLIFYRLFEAVDRRHAVLLVIFGGLMVTPIYFLNTINDVAALHFVRGAGSVSVFDQPQREALAMLFLQLHHHGVLVNQVFWGLWLFPFGILIYRSRFIPRFLGVWLIINGIAYLSISFTGLFFPTYEASVSNITFPAMLGEIAVMLWLIIKGAQPKGLAAPASS